MHKHGLGDIVQEFLPFLPITTAGNCPSLPRRKGEGDSKCQSQLSIDTTLSSGLGIVLMSGLWPTGEESLCFLLYHLWFALHSLFAILDTCLFCPRASPGLRNSLQWLFRVSCTGGYQLHTMRHWSCSCINILHRSLPSPRHIMALG